MEKCDDDLKINLSTLSNLMLLKLLREDIFELYKAGEVPMDNTYTICCDIQEELRKRLV